MEMVASTYIRVVPDLLDDVLGKVASVALEVTNLEGVLQAVKGLVRAEDAASLAELKALLLAFIVDALDPVLVLVDTSLINVVLELDDVIVRNGVGLNIAEDGSRALVDGANLERAGLGDGRYRESDDGPHNDSPDDVLNEGIWELVNLRHTARRDENKGDGNQGNSGFLLRDGR